MNKIWLFRAFKSEEDYQKGESYANEVFDDYQKLKNFSAVFSKAAKPKYPGYLSTYDIYFKDGTVDPKEVGIPNICFSLLEDNDKEDRKELFKQQRVERGFDNSETWCLASTIAAFTIPRLEKYIELSGEMLLRTEEQKEEIKAILTLMKLTVRDSGSWTFDKKEEEQVAKGLQALADNWFSLWW